jgi:hypothetical protein
MQQKRVNYFGQSRMGQAVSGQAVALFGSVGS